MMIKRIILSAMSLSLIFLVACKSSEDVSPASNQSITISSGSTIEDSEINNENEQNFIAGLDLSDYESLANEFLMPIAVSGIGAGNWTDPGDISSELFETFYAAKALPVERNLDEDTIVPESDYEIFIQKYFSVDLEHLKLASAHNADKKQYTIGYLGASPPFAVINANIDGDLLTLDYEYYSPADETTVIRIGTLKIEVSGEDYKYVSCQSNEME